jgi:hypothetical protein
MVVEFSWDMAQVVSLWEKAGERLNAVAAAACGREEWSHKLGSRSGFFLGISLGTRSAIWLIKILSL